ncbi:hypothetical protein ACFFX0_11060 [Citricoccus parietis]|uniref:Uncharacterized protein n=1 Tax=Citricoccus parietis TaxID=592307 RepID=A0ABV5FYF8_9MICC
MQKCGIRCARTPQPGLCPYCHTKTIETSLPPPGGSGETEGRREGGAGGEGGTGGEGEVGWRGWGRVERGSNRRDGQRRGRPG